MKTNYHLIIYLDKKLTKKIKSIQKRLMNLTGSRACLDLWKPHITIGSAIRVKDENLKTLFKDIKKATRIIKPFKIKIKNYGFMNNWKEAKWGNFTKYVIYLDVVINKELQKLAKIVKEKITDKKELAYGQNWPYNPHLTIAFGDLNYKGFIKAKKILKKEKFEDETIVDHITIARQNSNGTCPEFKRFNFR